MAKGPTRRPRRVGEEQQAKDEGLNAHVQHVEIRGNGSGQENGQHGVHQLHDDPAHQHVGEESDAHGEGRDAVGKHLDGEHNRRRGGQVLQPAPQTAELQRREVDHDEGAEPQGDGAVQVLGGGRQAEDLR